MTIKQQGGIFGRNPTFNDVDIEGTLTVNGEPISDFGSMAQQDADSVNVDGGSIDGVTLGTNSAVTDARIDNIKIDGNTISSTNTNGNVTITPDGSGRVVATNATIGGTDNSNPSLIVHSSNTNNAYLKFGSTGNVYGIFAGDYQGEMNLYTGGHDITFSPGGTNRIKFKTGGNIDMVSGGGNVLFASGAGIDFSATSGTGTSELFDDYEEGTWTPAINGTADTTYSTQYGWYTKVGNLVSVGFELTVNTKGTITGNAIIAGLPFTSGASDSKSSGSLSYSASSGFSSVWQGIIVGNNQTLISIYVKSAASGSTISLNGTDFFANGTQIIGQLTYKV